MYLIDMLAVVAKERKIKLNQEKKKQAKIKLDKEERERNEEEQLQMMMIMMKEQQKNQETVLLLKSMNNCKRKRSKREAADDIPLADHVQKIKGSNKLEGKELAAEEISDREELKRKTKSRKIMKKNKLVIDNNDGLKKMKKKKTGSSCSNASPDLPTKLKDRILIKANGGVIEDEILVIQKTLYKTDLDDQQNRFSIPIKQMLSKFLYDEEATFLENRVGKGCNVMEVDMIEPSGKIDKMNLSRWVMNKDVGKAVSVMYVLNGSNWQPMIFHNNLRIGDLVQLWATRINGNLCLSFVNLSKEEQEQGNNNNTGDNDGEASTSAAVASSSIWPP